MTTLNWIFGGIGAAVVGAIVTVYFSRGGRTSKQHQVTSGSGSTNIQVGGNVHIGANQSDREFAVQPIMHLSVNSGEGGPDGHFINGFIRNVGRGIARETKVLLPGLGNIPIDRLIKPMETVTIRQRYDQKSVFLQPLSDAVARVQFENELGTVYEQTGTVKQSKGSNSDVFSYGINALGPVTLIRSLTS